MRRVAVLGSTGSIGRQALDVIAANSASFQVCALAANQSIELLAEQANRLRPPVLSCGDRRLREELRKLLSYDPDALLEGPAGLMAAADASDADIVLAATDGMDALRPVFESASHGRSVALANKELLVAAGHLLCARARESGTRIVPVDSEHSAIFQCLLGERMEDVRSIVLTASGGPFRTSSHEQMENATPEQALRHPTWSMGAKNSLDSASLMNKGLEVIEASRLFDVTADQIDVVVHPQSIVHGFVVFADGNVKAQLASPDMKLPIAFALSFPERLPVAWQAAQEQLDATKAAIGLTSATSLSFEPVDQGRFPALRLAYEALRLGKTYPAVLSAANEEAGRAFLQRKIKFTEMCPLIERALQAHDAEADTLDGVERADRWARGFTRDAVNSRFGAPA
ncbi:MAG: 1-deoxy-D-xylulose-5-phosphate reductoisomerase [Candidatus Eremiobacter antarcticus]|nr:1-deoxy-D-xylulose-5-phosphate reductoisomerase [Candidatus Eremiobacteraeota bacterium]MBC5808919.1 1-deoxy-D-xylulose-5-phosphate reductoisomerase [Candidatus Eremiobacteraeota bacterium]PZR60397.1 MAG: 1-deoxy-D-xylulose-5-phosphate reductoisomerase [Candidatus Eremiobacter sp. RRmetagenome_bin22]